MLCQFIIGNLSYQAFQDPAAAQPSALSVTVAPDINADDDETGYNTSAAYRAMLAERLEIPSHVTTRLRQMPLPHAYLRYKAFNAAYDKLQTMIGNGTWVGKRPLKRDLMEVFARKSTFYKDHIAVFDQVHQYPDLKQWLEEDKDALTGVDLFGVPKQMYAFRDMRDYISRTQPGQRKRRASEGLVRAGKKARTVDGPIVMAKNVKTASKVKKGRAGGSRQTRPLL